MLSSGGNKVKVLACIGKASEIANEISANKPLGLEKRIINVPVRLDFPIKKEQLKFTHVDLIATVANKFNISTERVRRITYKFPNSYGGPNKNKMVDIADDEDVETFLKMVGYGTDLMILYVVVSSVAGVPSA